MSPAGLAFLGVGTFISAAGKYGSMMQQSSAEHENADFYRTQAQFAQEAGDRQKAVYHRESQVLFGEQTSGFAKAGVGASNSSFFLATQIAQRQSGEGAIDLETQLNVKLATARANEADQQASAISNAADSEQTAQYVQTAATVAMFV